MVRPIWAGRDSGPRPNPAIPEGCRIETIEQPTIKSGTIFSGKSRDSESKIPDVAPEPYCRMYRGQGSEEFRHLELTSAPKSQPHLGFWQPTILDEDESLGMNVGILDGSMFGKEQRKQR